MSSGKQALLNRKHKVQKDQEPEPIETDSQGDIMDIFDEDIPGFNISDILKSTEDNESEEGLLRNLNIEPQEYVTDEDFIDPDLLEDKPEEQQQKQPDKIRRIRSKRTQDKTSEPDQEIGAGTGDGDEDVLQGLVSHLKKEKELQEHQQDPIEEVPELQALTLDDDAGQENSGPQETEEVEDPPENNPAPEIESEKELIKKPNPEEEPDEQPEEHELPKKKPGPKPRAELAPKTETKEIPKRTRRKAATESNTGKEGDSMAEKALIKSIAKSLIESAKEAEVTAKELEYEEIEFIWDRVMTVVEENM